MTDKPTRSDYMALIDAAREHITERMNAMERNTYGDYTESDIESAREEHDSIERAARAMLAQLEPDTREQRRPAHQWAKDAQELRALILSGDFRIYSRPGDMLLLTDANGVPKYIEFACINFAALLDIDLHFSHSTLIGGLNPVIPADWPETRTGGERA